MTVTRLEDISASPRDTLPIFRDLYQKHNRAIRTFFLRRGFSKEQSRDLMQDTFLQVFKNISGFRGDAKISTWLRTVALNVMRQQLRHQGRSKRKGEEVSIDVPRGEHLYLVEPQDEASESAPLELILRDERAGLVRQAIADLPTGMRTMLQMSLQGFKNKEIASALQKTEGTVKSQLYEARARLQRGLADYFESG